jgi:hypothetical protein
VGRKRLADLCCAVKDAILWTSLDWREARGLAERAGIELCYPPGLGREDAPAVACAVHHAVHGCAAFAARLDALLASLHGDALEVIGSRSPEEIASWTKGDFAALPLPAAGLLWAVAADPRPELRPVEAWLTWRIQVEGLRAWSFGRVEILETEPM